MFRFRFCGRKRGIVGLRNAAIHIFWRIAIMSQFGRFYPLAGLCGNTCNPPQSAQGTLALLDWICRRKPEMRTGEVEM